MAIEIERKFLVIGDSWRSLAEGQVYRQGYIPTQDKTTVRIRVVGSQGYLTIKGQSTGMTRAEYEYPIPVTDAETILQTLCQPPLIEKIRYCIPIENVIWEVDEFTEENQGLILAEVELEEEQQTVNLPDWVGAEVTQDARYYNVNLAQCPYKQWA
jgi:CYTH domain-containing protein